MLRKRSVEAIKNEEVRQGRRTERKKITKHHMDEHNPRTQVIQTKENTARNEKTREDHSRPPSHITHSITPFQFQRPGLGTQHLTWGAGGTLGIYFRVRPCPFLSVFCFLFSVLVSFSFVPFSFSHFLLIALQFVVPGTTSPSGPVFSHCPSFPPTRHIHIDSLMYNLCRRVRAACILITRPTPDVRTDEEYFPLSSCFLFVLSFSV